MGLLCCKIRSGRARSVRCLESLGRRSETKVIVEFTKDTVDNAGALFRRKVRHDLILVVGNQDASFELLEFVSWSHNGRLGRNASNQLRSSLAEHVETAD